MQISKTDISRDSTEIIPLSAHRHTLSPLPWNLISANCISQAAPADRAFGCVVQWEVLAPGWEAGGREKPGRVPVSAQISSSVSVCLLLAALSLPQASVAPDGSSSVESLISELPHLPLSTPRSSKPLEHIPPIKSYLLKCLV